MDERQGFTSFPRQGFDSYSNSNSVDQRMVIDECTPTQTSINRQQPPQQPQTGHGFHLKSLDILWTYVNKELFISKIFYFFFFSAFGSLFPLMAVYFKQLGMNAIQAGMSTDQAKFYFNYKLILNLWTIGTLIGIRPFVEFVAAPFWSSIADRFHKSKLFLIFSLICWIVFTFSLAFIRPPASACVIFNDTHHILFTPYSDYASGAIEPDISENTNIDQKFVDFEHRIAKRGYSLIFKQFFLRNVLIYYVFAC